MILFMLYALVLGTLAALAAARVEAALHSRGLPTRWVWLASLGATVGAGAWALLRPPASGPSPAWSAIPVALSELRDVVAPPLSVLQRADGMALTLWIVASAVLAVSLFGGLLRLAHRARGWVPARVSDALVLVSDDFGPAVLGVRRPRVVLPRWALGMQPERLRLVVLHEEEHQRARDVALLFAGWMAVILAPWNLALWWQFHRLRAAVEMDCDARVLGRGAPAALYGRILLEMGTHDTGLLLPVAALSRPPSLLERRLRMIVRGGNRGSVGRSLGALAVAAVLVVVACETPMPTAVRPARDEAAAPSEVSAQVISERDIKLQKMVNGIQDTGGALPIFVVNGNRVSDITGIAPENIERVEVVKGGAAQAVYGSEGAGGVVYIFTKDAPEDFKALQPRPATGESESVRPAPTGGDVVKLRSGSDVRVYIDGALFEGDIESIDKNTIDRIDVVKGKEAGGSSSIYITLKRLSR